MNIGDKTILNVIAKSSEAFLLLVSSVIMVRVYSKGEYGTFLQIMLIVNTIIMLTYWGIPQSIYYFLPRTSQKKTFVIKNFILSVFIALIAFFISFFLADSFPKWFSNENLREYTLIYSLIILFKSPSKLMEPFLISTGHLVLNSFFVVIINLLAYLPIIICSLLMSSIRGLLQAIAVSAVLEFLLYFGIVLWLFGENQKKSQTNDEDCISIVQQLRYALPIGVSSQLGVLSKQMDQYIVSLFFLPVDFSVYSRGAIRIPVLSSIPFTINNIRMPDYVTSYQNGEIKKFLLIYHQCIEAVAKINIPFFFLLFSIAPPLISILYTEQYADSAWVLRVYSILLVIGIAVYGIIPRATGKTTSILYSTIILLISNVVLSLAFIFFWGAIGAAIASIVASVISAAYLLFHSVKILNVAIKDLFPWRYLYKTVKCSLIAVLSVFVINLFVLTDSNLGRILLIISDCSVYIYAYLFVGMRQQLFSDQDFSTLRNWFRFDVKKLIVKFIFLEMNTERKL